ncbi:cation transport ATPase [Gynuella sunshinyii YC6258]|uniref:Cation transport ATPase n=2 Tax=Gynuella sunshinyii TaxID=1445505 RepID=A0A0C5V556_9GAMM|nr:cation transport ATPase [Gynuella sunshinyii YC6258]
MAAALAIAGCGLDQFYKFRENASENPETFRRRHTSQYKSYDDPDIQDDFVDRTDPTHASFTLAIEGISCAACVWLIEKRLLQLEGIHQANLNLTNHQLRIEIDLTARKLSQVFVELHHLGYRGKPYQPSQQVSIIDRTQKDFLVRIGIAGIGMMQVMMNTFAIYLGQIDWQFENLLRWTSLILTLPVFFYSAFPFYQAALRDLKSRHLGMDVPVSLAIILAFVPSVWATFTQTGETYYESVTMFTFFLLLGRFLEFRARQHLAVSSNSIDDLVPATAHVVKEDQLLEIPSKKLTVNDIIEILPGESAPADGSIISGQAAIDESMITGEFDPVHKQPGDHILAGSTNTEGVIRVQVSHAPSSSSISLMVRLLNRMEAEKPRIAEIADQGASTFVLVILALSIFTGIGWYFVDSERAFWIALSVLVVTCPCALSLATPVALTASSANLRTEGIIATRGHALPALAGVSEVVFDKTGTLTNGQFDVVQVKSLSNQWNEHQILITCAALEAHSEHPVAVAFKPFIGSLQVRNISVHTSEGIEGFVDSHQYRLGKPEWIRPGITRPGNGHWLLLSSADTDIAWIEVADQLRPDAMMAVQALKQKTLLTTHMLTGDRTERARQINDVLRLDHVAAEQSPHTKVQYIEAIEHPVLMIGDGLNDTLSLSRADVSIAMASATELTKQTADILLLNNQLAKIPMAIILARKTQRIIRQNLAWGLIYNLIALPLAMTGLISPWMAAVGMSFSSLLVVLNALRLTRKVQI